MCLCIITAVTQRFWPTAQHQPPLLSPLYISLPFTFCWAESYIPRWQKLRGLCEQRCPGIGQWGSPSHSDGLHKCFLRENKGGEAITLMFHIPSATTLSHRGARHSAQPYFQIKYACFHMFCDGWGTFLCVWSKSHTQKEILIISGSLQTE